MTRGSIRFETDEEMGFLLTLKTIYEYESTRIDGPGSYHRDIQDVIWTKQQLYEAHPELEADPEHLDALIGWMTEHEQIMAIPYEKGKHKYITRVAEIVRLLGHTYEYWHKGRPGIESSRWYIVDKKIPRRDIPAEEVKGRLKGFVQEELGPEEASDNLMTAIDLVVEGIARTLKGDDWKDARFSEFQVRTAEEMLLSQYKKGNRALKRTQIITAGVGSGKTIGFTMGMMISAVRSLRDLEPRMHLFLYPRTALAKDQYNKLLEISKNIPLERLEPHFEHYDHYKGIKVGDGVRDTYKGRFDFPVLVVTTLETLKRRLQQPPFAKKVKEALSRVVLDEVHLVEELTGLHIVHLLKRLESIAPRGGPLWTASSATVACPERHAAMVFGVKEEDVVVIEPEDEDMETVGLVHHVFLRPGDRISLLGCLTNGSSILVHNRRKTLSDRPGKEVDPGPDDVREHQKTIGFADNLDMLGRWNAELRENERTENDTTSQGGRTHPVSDRTERWGEKQREVPYALRFHGPFTRRLKVLRGQTLPDGTDERYEPISMHIDTDDPCGPCREGKRLSFGMANERDLNALARLVYREPSLDSDHVKRFNICNPSIFESGSKEIGTMDLCPYLRSGSCFWFLGGEYRTGPIPTTYDRTAYEFEELARSRVFSSKVGKTETENDDLPTATFTSMVNELYGPFYDGRTRLRGRKKILTDMVLASPSLEVGIDLDNVTESFLFKAIRNVSSYRQKVGRIGRESGSDTLNVTLLSKGPMDMHYYRQPRKLMVSKTLDPIPLKKENPMVMRSSAYMAVWDHLALNADLPETIPTSKSPRGGSKFTTRIEICLDHMKKEHDRILEHLRYITEGLLDVEELDAAIGRVRMDLETFLVPTEGILEGKGVTNIAEIVVNALKQAHSVQLENCADIRGPWRDIRSSEGRYDDERPRIDSIALNMSSEFEQLDTMRNCGWNKGPLDELITSLDAKGDRRLRAILVDLERISEALEKIMEHGDPKVLFFKKQFHDTFEEAFGKAYYLSYLIEEMPLFDGRIGELRYPRPKNLFTNPYEPEVLLRWFRRRGVKARKPERALISEVLHSYLPGTWTFRLGQPVKVDVGRLAGRYNSLRTEGLNPGGSGSVLTELAFDVQGPPIFGGGLINLYQPHELRIRDATKYVLANKVRGTIVDFDEDDLRPAEENEKHVKIPRSFLEGWTHIDYERRSETPVGVYAMGLGDGRTRLVKDPDREDIVLGSSIRHPIATNLVTGVKWVPRMEVIEYVFSVSRSFTSNDMAGSTLTYYDPDNNSRMGIGRLLNTEGLYLKLDPTVVGTTITKVKELLDKDPTWAPTSLLAFKAMLGQVTIEGAHISPFLVNDVASIVLYSMIDELGTVTFPNLVAALTRLVGSREELEGLVRTYVIRKHHALRDDAIIDGTEFPEETEEDIQKETQRICEALTTVSLEVSSKDMVEFMDQWVPYTLLITFGIVAYSSAQRLCGTGGDKIGYMPDLEMGPHVADGTEGKEGTERNRYGVYIYDRDEHGNGSCETLRRFLHILYLQRFADSAKEESKLPTEDFLTVLEQELLQCPQFHTDMNALEMFHDSSAISKSGIKEFGDLHEDSQEIESMSRDVWKALKIEGRKDAWRLPLLAQMSHLAAYHFGLAQDDVTRATTICWTGCPECVLSNHVLMGPLRGRDYVDKAILDLWFKLGTGSTQEYKSPTAQEIATGSAGLEIGAKSRLSIIDEKKRFLRGVSLPFTIGLELDRINITEGPHFVIRENDVEGMRLTEEPTEGKGIAISVGFGRLVWYNLFMTGYLDTLGLIPDERKEVFLVTFDMSDIPLINIGMSEKMWESIEYQRRKEDQSGRLERISDLLGWLAHRGFRLTLCMDTKRSRNEWSDTFLSRLRAFDPKGDNIKLMTKTIEERGVYHSKIMVTPVGAIKGSPNLTKNAIYYNEETFDYYNYDTREYRETAQRLNDALYGAKEWRSE